MNRYKTLADLYARCKAEGDCLLWLGQRDKWGYGRIRTARKPAKWQGAHRRVWQMAYGEIPDGHHIHHTCEQPACINLEHLVVMNGVEHGRLHKGATGTCAKGHENWEVRRDNGRRRCLTCSRERAREYKRNKRS